MSPVTRPDDSSIAAMVIANPAAALVFERHGIDYCCRGRRTLAEACADSGVDAAVLAAEVAGLGSDSAVALPDDVAGLIDHIVVSHHVFLRDTLPRLRELMDKVVAAHGAAHPEVQRVSTLLTEIDDDLMPHLLKEEQILFPISLELLRATGPTEFHCGSVRNPISVMLMEHDRVGELLAALRDATDAYTPPADACPTWHALYTGLAELEADTHRHVHAENNVLFPMVVAAETALG